MYPKSRRRVLQPILSGPQEGWWVSPHPQSETLQQVCGEGAFQNAAHTSPAVYGQAERLVKQRGPSRCIFPLPSDGKAQKVSSVLLSGSVLPVHFLPFRYRLSPITFMRCIKAALRVLICKGIRLAWFLDDLLVMAKSPELSGRHTQKLIEFVEYIGFTINYKKSAPWPACQATYLALRLDTV